MTLSELASLLHDYTTGTITLAAVRERLWPVLAADPLDVTTSDAEPWDRAPDDERLFWRLIYLVESSDADGAPLRDRIARVLTALASTGSAHATHELLPLVLDAPRFGMIVRKHRDGIVSRTGLLAMIAESGYPAHVKLWLQHASPSALARLSDQLDAGAYDAVARGFDVRPD